MPTSREWRSLPCAVHSINENLHDNFRPHPMGANTRQTLAFRERRFRYFDLVELGPQVEQQLRVKARTDFACKDEIVSVEISDEHRAETGAAALRVGEASDDQFLRRLAFHLQP